jgi:hypothetical protein
MTRTAFWAPTVLILTFMVLAAPAAAQKSTMRARRNQLPGPMREHRYEDQRGESRIHSLCPQM